MLQIMWNWTNNIYIITQIRGRAPVFFQKVDLISQTEITRNRNLTIESFTKHNQKIQKDYPLVFYINLLIRKKPGENVIIKEFENQIKMRAKIKKLKYYFFDMKNECKNDNYHKTDNLKYCSKRRNISIFCEDGLTGEVHKEQRGIFRTNCLEAHEKLKKTNLLKKMIFYSMIFVSNIIMKISFLKKEL